MLSKAVLIHQREDLPTEGGFKVLSNAWPAVADWLPVCTPLLANIQFFSI
jgi:hypothetical protein